jgi:hypothetical protein
MSAIHQFVNKNLFGIIIDEHPPIGANNQTGLLYLSIESPDLLEFWQFNGRVLPQLFVVIHTGIKSQKISQKMSFLAALLPP